MKLFLGLLSLLIITACGSGASDRILFETNLLDYHQRQMHLGDEVLLEISGKSYDSLKLFLNGRNVGMDALTLKSSNSQYGSNRLLMEIYYEGSKVMKREASILILPKSKPSAVAYEVVARYAHDPSNFTQGFYYEDGKIYEGTGLNGSSKLEVYELSTQKVISRRELENRYFGEGIAKVENRIFQLTYQAGKALVYSADDLTQLTEFNYPFSTQGWGLCFDGNQLILSNGSEWLYFVSPEDFSLKGQIQVVSADGMVDRLNELEFHNGLVYANVWYEDFILAIDPSSGKVVERIVLPERPDGTGREDVANGIAFKDDNLLVTGKNWPVIYELKKTN